MHKETRSERRARIERPEHLRRILSYDPATGYLTWLGSNHHGRRAGTITSDGYLRVSIEMVDFKAHRVAWAIHTGMLLKPGQHIDHINGDKTDNRIANLRLCTPKENQENSRRPKNNTTGFKGVSPFEGRFRAAIGHNGKQHHLGLFNTPEEAHAAYVSAAKVLRWPLHRPN